MVHGSGKDRLYVMAWPLRQHHGVVLGAFLTSMPHATLTEAFVRLQEKITIAGFSFMVIGSLVFLVLTRRLNRPVYDIFEQCEAIRRGEYGGKELALHGDEFSMLATGIHEMGLDLKEKSDLEHYFSSLSEDFLDVPQEVQEEGVWQEYAMDGEEPWPEDLVFADRYQIKSFLGQGSSGMVYAAEDVFLHEEVAIKVFDEWNWSEEKLAAFKQEIVMMRKITHPNVTRVHEFGSFEGVHYMVMEWVKGGHLRQLLRRQGALEFHNALILIRQLCQALDQAHAVGVVHLDIKPENVLIGCDGKIKLNDFGISHWFQSGPSEAKPTGTPGYMSPEQVLGDPLHPNSDIYSLGVFA